MTPPDLNYEREPVLDDQDSKDDVQHEQRALEANPPADPPEDGAGDVDPAESAEADSYVAGIDSLERAEESLDDHSS